MIDEDPVAVASKPVDPFDVSVDDGGDDLYRVLEPELLRFAVGLVGAADAPDVLSAAFARVVGHETWSTVASHRKRAVIVLTYWADLDPASVAHRLGISEGSVRRHLARARAALRKVLP